MDTWYTNINRFIFPNVINYVILSSKAFIKFSVDDEVIGLVETNDGHYHRTRSVVNIWDEGNLDAPFDQEVCIFWTVPY